MKEEAWTEMKSKTRGVKFQKDLNFTVNRDREGEPPGETAE